VPVEFGAITREDLLVQENKDLRKALNQARQSALYDERMIMLLEASLEPKRPELRAAGHAEREGFTAHEFLLQWSDLHGCENVSLEQTNGLNEYGWETMVARHWRMRDAILSFKRHRPYPVKRLTIVPGGDMVSGDIHDELRETNEKVLMEAAIDIGLFGADWIASLARSSKRSSSTAWSSATTAAARRSRRRRTSTTRSTTSSTRSCGSSSRACRTCGRVGADGRIKRARHSVHHVAGKQILCWHGDGVRSTMVGVPWGGITRRCNELQKQYEQHGKIDHFLSITGTSRTSSRTGGSSSTGA
jgi:hypothetical protein